MINISYTLSFPSRADDLSAGMGQLFVIANDVNPSCQAKISTYGYAGHERGSSVIPKDLNLDPKDIWRIDAIFRLCHTFHVRFSGEMAISRTQCIMPGA